MLNFYHIRERVNDKSTLTSLRKIVYHKERMKSNRTKQSYGVRQDSICLEIRALDLKRRWFTWRNPLTVCFGHWKISIKLNIPVQRRKINNWETTIIMLCLSWKNRIKFHRVQKIWHCCLIQALMSSIDLEKSLFKYFPLAQGQKENLQMFVAIKK